MLPRSRDGGSSLRTRAATGPRPAPAQAPEPKRPGSGWALRGVRYVLPIVVTLVGLVMMSFGSDVDLEGGASLVSAGLAIYFINWLFRIGVTGDQEREREDEARDYFDEHGRWPS
jgi:hypothetical protein